MFGKPWESVRGGGGGGLSNCSYRECVEHENKRNFSFWFVRLCVHYELFLFLQGQHFVLIWGVCLEELMTLLKPKTD